MCIRCHKNRVNILYLYSASLVIVDRSKHFTLLVLHSSLHRHMHTLMAQHQDQFEVQCLAQKCFKILTAASLSTVTVYGYESMITESRSMSLADRIQEPGSDQAQYPRPLCLLLSRIAEVDYYLIHRVASPPSDLLTA